MDWQVKDICSGRVFDAACKLDKVLETRPVASHGRGHLPTHQYDADTYGDRPASRSPTTRSQPDGSAP
eukprot:16360777-Heterocapsa_arctica.AAC.1